MATFAAAGLLIAYSVLFRPVSHDEGQYVSAVAMMRLGWPYLDFAYLQTPLQPMLLSPLSSIPAGWLFVAVRCVNGIFAFVTLGLLYFTLVQRVRAASALIAVAALAISEPFLLAGGLARNDALPMMLLAGALLALFHALDRREARHALGLAGLLLGLATSTKISFALPAAGAGIFLLLRIREIRARGIIAFSTGAVGGLIANLIFAAAAPAQYWFGVFAYSLEAPRQWWTATGHVDRLEPMHRILTLIALAGRGAILPALAAAPVDRRCGDDRLLLDLMIVGGLLAAYMPEPAYSQYLVPLLPPLFARLALAIDRPSWGWRKPLMLLIAAGSMATLYGAGRYAVQARKRGIDLVNAARDGRKVALIARGGTIATLSPQLIAGSDTNMDRRFVTGPFLFRTFGALGDQGLRYGYSPGWQRLNIALDAHPPEVILVGRERKPWPPLFPRGLDAPLEDWAEAHHYTRMELSNGSVAFVTPR